MNAQLVILFAVLFAVAYAATDVKKCSGNKPFPLEVRIYGCDTPPCIVVKGSVMDFDIDFVVYKYVTNMETKVRATTLGITVPYELPPEVSAVCPNLQYGAYCPLYPEEDVTYKFLFPISDIYPEISVKVEISLVDQDNEVLTCFTCDIKVRKGESHARLGGKA